MAAYNSAYTGEQIDEAIGQVSHKADTALSNLSDNATALYNLGAASNPNLLDNWYFADPIDQRQGYVVPPGTAYYSDTGLAAQEGTVSGYTTANYVDGVYGSVTVSGVAYYVNWTQAVRGYTGYGSNLNIYSIDRWVVQGNYIEMLIQEDGLLINNPDSVKRWILQKLPQGVDYFVNKTVTLSVLLGDGTLCHVSKKFETTDPVVLDTEFDTVTLRWQIANNRHVQFVLHVNSMKAVTITAAKLELGPVQTLAHQDADGNWVLNDPPPNRALEMLKCQRYYQLFSSAAARPSNLADYRPAMRANPALGTINVNGQTMYFSDASL